MSIAPWDSFAAGGDFFDPFEGRKVSTTVSFFEDPFANQLPKNGWCGVPRFYSDSVEKKQCGPRFYSAVKKEPTRRRPWQKQQQQQPRRDKAPKKEAFEGVSYTSYHSFDLPEDEDEETEEESVPSLTIEKEWALPAIAEDTAVFAKLPSLKKVTPEEVPLDASIDEYERVAQERALRRVHRWLHQTGLVDELCVDPKTLPQNRYSSQDSITTTKSQEGIEIGPHGVTLLGDGDGIQVATHFKQFRAVTLREMDKIDDELVQHERTLPDHPKDDIRKYPPIVQSTVHARLNIGRVFTEVDYFNKIPETCDLLTTELAETEGDWEQVKDIVDDHVAMQSFLVGLAPAWLERAEDKRKVEAFLTPSIRAVRELGHHVRSKLLLGIGTAFGEGNVDDVKCLVDAMQLYENEVEELNTANQPHVKIAQAIMVTGIKKIAMERILEDSDIRGHEVFQCFQEEAADDAVSTTAEQAIFDAVIKASETLLEAIDVVNEELIPLFPSSWNVFPIWAACVGSVCSQYFLQQIGGQEGNHLTFLTPNQLLKSLTWIESFREKVGFSSVNLDNYKPEFVTAQDLMKADMGHKSLAKVVTVLWDIHRLLEDQFILATQVQTNNWLDSVFAQDHSKSQTTEGRLITSLPEDLWVLASAHLTTIKERVARDSSVFFHAAMIIFGCLQVKQRIAWREYHEDVETCCAAANDAMRMIELAEVELEDIKYDSEFSAEQFAQLDTMLEQVTTQFVKDAVYSAKKVHIFMFVPIENALAGRMFELEWEELTHNDIAVTVVRTLDDYLGDMEKWLEESMLRKVIDAIVRATVNFYIKNLLLKSIRRKRHTFSDPKRALQRISGDICTFEDFFEGWVEKFPALERVLEIEFEVLYAILELLEIGVGTSHGRDPSDFFPFLLKKIGRLDGTKFLCCQMWHLLSVDGGRKMRDLFDDAKDRLVVLDEVLKEACDPSLQLGNVVEDIVVQLRERLKVKSKVTNVRKSLVTKAGKIKKRASQAIDRVAAA